MTTMHTECTDRLSDYLDDELTPDERHDVDAHLAGCAECRLVLDELRQVVMRAKTLDAQPPQADLWPGVQQRIDRIAVRRVSFTLPQALAASLVIALLSGAIVWMAVGSPKGLRYANATSGANTTSAANTTSGANTTSVPNTTVGMTSEPVAQGFSPALEAPHADVATVSYADAQYDAAVSDLEKALKEGRGRLDQSTIAIVEHNLQIIDQAIEQAKQALEADPANSYLSGHLVEARRRKLDLLRRATALTEGD
jgi:predicted anti-sigma-YlaC factor YlaD